MVPYDPVWKEEFEKEKALLLKEFGNEILAIEHIGSTAIEGISAKPIIDINIAVRSLDSIEPFIQKLPELGYEYIPERRFAGRQFFPKGPRNQRTHHLNLVEVDSDTGWKIHLLFRDHLRTHPEIRKEYKNLKLRLAEKYADDRGEYTEQKARFIREIIEKARNKT